MRKGYLTVYLSLSLAVLIAFILTLVEGVRTSATSMRAVCVADIGINSTLSEYNKALFDRYDLLFVDESYGGGSGGIGAVRARLEYYLRQNLDNGTPDMARDLLGMNLKNCNIEEYALATDNNGEAVLRQVSDYMNTTLKGLLISGVDDLTGELSNAGFSYDIEGKRSEVQAQIDAVELPIITNEEGEEEQITLSNPADNVNSMRGAGVLGFVLSDTSSISQKRINASQYCSNRKLCIGNGISEEERQLGREAGKLTYDEYLFDKLGYYRHVRDNSLLNYQIEYVIKARESDWDNLEAVCKTILLWREAINFVYLSLDSQRRSEAEAIAAALTAVIFCPELKDPVMWSILLAWAYLEALQDLKILLEGGGVPPFKSSSTWHTSITDLFHPRTALKSYPGQGGAKYGDYLKTMLLMTSFTKVVPKSFDIYEMDVRLASGNDSFKMDYCLQSFLAYIVTNSSYGHSVQVRRRGGYYYAS